MLRFRDLGVFVFEFWVLRFRDLGASFSRFDCFVLRSSFSSALFSKLPVAWVVYVLTYFVPCNFESKLASDLNYSIWPTSKYKYLIIHFPYGAFEG